MSNLNSFLEILLESARAGTLADSSVSSVAPPASQSAIEELADVDLEDERVFAKLKDEPCPICATNFEQSDVYAKRMPCKHTFHFDCLLPWLEKTNTCPLCRFALPTLDAAYEARRRMGSRTNNYNDDDDDDDDGISRFASSSMFM